jgi:hypothetical protein
MSFVHVVARVLAGGLLAFAGTAFAVQIGYNATDLPDTTVGQDLWQMDYQLSGSFAPLEGVEIEFAPDTFALISLVPGPYSDVFDSLVVQPLPAIAAPGLLQLTALRAVVEEGFSFQALVVRVGAAPGAQTYKVFDTDFNPIAPEVRVTVAGIPEPATAWLMLGALCLLPWLRRRAG